MNKKQWYYTALASIVLSIVTLFLPIISYGHKGSETILRYNVLGLLNGSKFTYQVLNEYHGAVFTVFSIKAAAGLTILICFIGISAIAISLLGLQCMVKQYSNARPFRLTIAGLVGTAIPALTLLILYVIAKDHFPGQLSLGLYVYITPAAMILACLTVIKRHKLTQEQAALQKQAAQYLRPAGNLDAAR